MCGIIGYIGPKPVVPVILDGLRRLEYRGYDSWGVAWKEGGALNVKKEIGKISGVNGKELSENSSLAIGHTRWATHGGVTKINAHPHLNEDHTIAVIHNGIIENHAELREQLAEKGVKFSSETDTEVLTQLVGSLYVEGVLLEDAVATALAQVRGTYGLAVAAHVAAVRFLDPPRHLLRGFPLRVLLQAQAGVLIFVLIIFYGGFVVEWRRRGGESGGGGGGTAHERRRRGRNGG
mgnify:CR=1 FL=1